VRGAEQARAHATIAWIHRDSAGLSRKHFTTCGKYKLLPLMVMHAMTSGLYWWGQDQAACNACAGDKIPLNGQQLLHLFMQI
jgi:hypothetical protein